MEQSLVDQVALVAGGTRGAGRGIATELGAAGATVYVIGRTTRTQRSPMNRPETIEEIAELVSAAGGYGIAVPVDHSDPLQVDQLLASIEREHWAARFPGDSAAERREGEDRAMSAPGLAAASGLN
jgi:NAD(P)-dependent dehydrogenase (short-subunit alcohol dehydrogenase family)